MKTNVAHGNATILLFFLIWFLALDTVILPSPVKSVSLACHVAKASSTYFLQSLYIAYLDIIIE